MRSAASRTSALRPGSTTRRATESTSLPTSASNSGIMRGPQRKKTTPSPTSPASRSIFGPRAAMWIGRRALGGRRSFIARTRWPLRSARTASAASRVRVSGRENGTSNHLAELLHEPGERRQLAQWCRHGHADPEPATAHPKAAGLVVPASRRPVTVPPLAWRPQPRSCHRRHRPAPWMKVARAMPHKTTPCGGAGTSGSPGPGLE